YCGEPAPVRGSSGQSMRHKLDPNVTSANAECRVLQGCTSSLPVLNCQIGRGAPSKVNTIGSRASRSAIERSCLVGTNCCANAGYIDFVSKRSRSAAINFSD